MSTFYGLNIAHRALSAAQKGIDVTGHNIANASTPGYTRQRLALAAIDPPALNSRFMPGMQGKSGGGVEILTVEQLRNPFLDRQFRHENALTSEYQTRRDELYYLEGLFDELSNVGLSATMNDFLDSLQEASKSPTNVEQRTNMLQNAIKLTETFHHYARQMQEKHTELDRTVQVMAGQINDIARSVSDLNQQIVRFELGGQKANDLRDKRNLLLDELSQLTAFSASEDEGRLQVKIGETLLVDHHEYQTLSTERTVTDLISGQEDALLQLIWENSGEAVTTADLQSGSLKAVLDLRDGNAPDDIGVPFLYNQISRLARGFAEAFNEVHAQGWSLPKDGEPSQTGQDFFAVPADGPITAKNIAIDPAILADVSRIALSGQEITSPAQAGDNAQALALIDLFNNYEIPDIGHFGSFLQSFVAELAVETAHSQKLAEGQNLLVQSIEEQRQSISGVSLDEEMTNLITLQHSYAAASRMITAIDQNLDVLINRTGVVGR